MEKEIIHIREPYWSACYKYNWLIKTPGLGIDLRKLNGENNLYVKVGKNDSIWVINKKIARQFIEKNKSYYDAKGIKLGVLAWNLFRKEKDISENQKKLL